MNKPFASLLAMIAAILLVPSLAMAGGDDPPQITLRVHPVVMNASTSSIDIMWENSEADPGKIRIGTQSNLSGAALLTDSRDIKIHKVTINGLQANRKYYYRIELANQSSPINSFTTSPASTNEPFRLVMLGDTRKGYGPEAWLLEAGEDDDHRAVQQAALNRAPDVYLNSGDFGFAGQDEDDVINFFKQEKQLLGNSVFYPVYGNHDFAWFFGLSDASLGTGNTYFDSYFMVPGNGAFDYYSFNYSNVHFLVINSNGCNSAETCADTFAPGTAQYAFIQSDLASAAGNPNVDHIVVSHHHPAVGAGGVDSEFNALFPLYTQYGVDTVVTGHVHNYERATKDGITYVVTGGGGSPLSGTDASSYTNAIAKELNFVVGDFTSAGASFTSYGVVGDDNTATWVLDSWNVQY
ncbi:MAG: metallophosphoesterase family protein [Chrysiogenetes bacterium]|nr:metallophosphoesterase family protein [Chrysiogenetes bacterium]